MKQRRWFEGPIANRTACLICGGEANAFMARNSLDSGEGVWICAGTACRERTIREMISHGARSVVRLLIEEE